MRRAVLATILLTACSFEHGTPADPVDGGPPPYMPGGDAGSGITTPSTKCHSTLSGLWLCLDFEPPNVGQDESGLGNQVNDYNVESTPRAMQNAAELDDTSAISVAGQPVFGTTSRLTMEMWIAPDQQPFDGDRWYMTESYSSFGLWLEHGAIGCGVAPTADQHDVHVGAPDAFGSNQWHHVGCVYDGSTLALYIDGTPVSCQTGTAHLAPTSPGVNIGAGFLGGLDDVHIYTAALTSADMCQLAGATNCKPGCR